MYSYCCNDFGAEAQRLSISHSQLFLVTMSMTKNVGKGTPVNNLPILNQAQVVECCCARVAKLASGAVSFALIFGLHLLHQGKRWKSYIQEECCALKATPSR